MVKNTVDAHDAPWFVSGRRVCGGEKADLKQRPFDASTRPLAGAAGRFEP
jgi:hypothetical protein